MSPKGGLYIIWFSDTHYYGGRASNFTNRWAQHRYGLRRGRHCNRYLQFVFNKYGRFEPVILTVQEDPILQLRDEQEWLDLNYGQPGCLNLSRWADRGSNRGRLLSPEHKARIAASSLGKKMSPDSRAKMSISQKKRRATPETKLRMSVAHKGSRHTEESKRKMSEAAKARYARTDK